MSEKLINEEFKVWKKASPMLYDLIYTYSCDWPSLTVQWLHDLNFSAQNDQITAKFLLGTHTTGDVQNYLKLHGVNLPSTLVSDKNFGSHPVSQLEPVDPETSQRRLHLLRKWKHPGETNKVRFDEQLGLVATQTNSGDILIYDYNDSTSDTSVRTLKYHSREGFGLEWSPKSPGKLLSGNEDTKIALWDLSTLRGAIDSQQSKSALKPSRVFGTHTGIINDLSWNCASPDIFASISDDGSLQIHDLRAGDEDVAIRVDKAHDEKAINAVEFHPTLSSFLSTGAVDGSIFCWDLRDVSTPMKKLYGHTGPVLNLKFKDNLMLSTSVDRRVLLWDLNRISAQDSRDHDRRDENADPSLVFVHGGHTGRLCEADWHPALDNVIISCAEDSLVEIWRPLHIEDDFDYEEQEAEEKQQEKEEEEQNKKQEAENEAATKKEVKESDVEKPNGKENVTVKTEVVIGKDDNNTIANSNESAANINSTNDVTNATKHHDHTGDINMD